MATDLESSFFRFLSVPCKVDEEQAWIALSSWADWFQSEDNARSDKGWDAISCAPERAGYSYRRARERHSTWLVCRDNIIANNIGGWGWKPKFRSSSGDCIAQ